MTPKQRWIILGSLLLATLAAGYLLDDEPAPQKSKRKGSVATKSGASSSGDARRADRKAPAAEVAAAPLVFPEPATVEEGDAGKKVIDPFRTKNWYVAPPPPKPPKPTAPPLPFQFLGKINEDGVVRVFLNSQGKHIIAKVGDVIDNTYTVEEISGGRMVLLYQPLNEKQVLAIGAEK